MHSPRDTVPIGGAAGTSVEFCIYTSARNPCDLMLPGPPLEQTVSWNVQSAVDRPCRMTRANPDCQGEAF